MGVGTVLDAVQENNLKFLCYFISKIIKKIIN